MSNKIDKTVAYIFVIAVIAYIAYGQLINEVML